MSRWSTWPGARAACLALALTWVGAAGAVAQTFAIRGGTVHTLAGAPFVGTVVISGGRIQAVGEDVAIPAGAETIDATGRHVYPGMIDAMSLLGLTEVESLGVTNDMREQGNFNPQLQAATAIHPASELIPVARANGITLSITAPQGGNGGIAGQAALVGLDGWTVEEMSVEPDAAMVVNYPVLSTGGRGGRRAGEERYAEQVSTLDEWMEAGREYARAREAGAEVHRDLALEAMARVVSGEMPVLLSADGERNIRNAVEWAEEQGIRYAITGGRDAWRIADWLAERDVGVILSLTQAMPSGPDGAYDEMYAGPGKLYEAGVKIAFATFGAADSRTLPYQAAQAVPYGLPVEAAIEAVTKNAAEMLGFDDRVGTLEVGKLANVIVTDGNPLEIQTEVTDLFILGRSVDTDNRHRELYEEYRARPRRRIIS